ncbi:MAG TPA: ATP-binding protein [Vicinamibacterales bacterium]|nr:ATP-binding protein [Vicinamibacterales bacterium]
MTGHLRRKLMWLIGGRAAAVTLLLGSAILLLIRSPGTRPIDPFFFLIGLTYGLTVLYVALMRFVERHRWLLDVQLACDALLVSALVHLTGGVTSYFSTLYALPIIAASTIQSRRGGIMVGFLSSVMYAGIVAAQYHQYLFGAAEFTGADALPAPYTALFTVGLNLFGFTAVALLSGYLAEGLQRAGEELEVASNQLADLQAFSEYAINSLASGLLTTDRAGRVLTFNRAAESITGLLASVAVGRSAQDVLQLPPQVIGLFGPAEDHPPLPRVEYPFTKGDGRTIELGISTATLMTPRGETGFVITFQDVTEARRRERDARIQQRLAAVGEMAAGIAHEIRNPLASMSGSLQILRQELPLSEEQAQLMDIVLRESERLNETIKSFLAYARPQRSAAARLDVRGVITDTARLLENSSELHDTHRIAVTVPDAEIWCLADEAQIRQIVWNLATNGLRAMPDGGNLTLSAGPGSPGIGEVVIAVQDEGVGMAADELDGILQPFRGGFARGTGLGLSIVHRIVSDYGGELIVTSQPGEGTTVTVRLPAGSAQPAPGAAPADAQLTR